MVCSASVVLLLVSLVFNSLVDAVQFHSPDIQVTDFKLPAYLGRWYQVYASQNSLTTYEAGATCIVEDHTRFFGPSLGVVATFGVELSFK